MTLNDVLHHSIIFLLFGVVIRETRADEPEAIVSGYIAIEGEFPFVVGLRYDDRFRCGGSIIGARHILTAAHCVHELVADRLTVRSGTIWREWYGQHHSVDRIITHPDYNLLDVDKHGYDVAVLTLKSGIVLDDMNAIIPIASLNTPEKVKAELIGWGRTKVNGTASEIQRKSYAHTIKNNYCRRKMRRNLLPTQLCTLEPKGTGSCMGDSGSPLVYNNEIVGVMSWSISCALGVPDVYTRIYSFRWFIRDAMNNYP